MKKRKTGVNSLPLPEAVVPEHELSWIRVEKDGAVSLMIQVQPRAASNRVAGLQGDALKLCITSPPVDGKANEAVISLLAKILKIPKASISIQSGKQGRKKRILLSDCSIAGIRAALGV